MLADGKVTGRALVEWDLLTSSELRISDGLNKKYYTYEIASPGLKEIKERLKLQMTAGKIANAICKEGCPKKLKAAGYNVERIGEGNL